MKIVKGIWSLMLLKGLCSRCIILLFIMLSTGHVCCSQIGERLVGSWVKVQKEGSSEYLKYTFTDNGNFYAYASYSANGINAQYSFEDNVVSLSLNGRSLNRKFQVEKLDDESLILVELENGRLPDDPIRMEFVKEEIYLNRLPLNEEDKVTLSNDSAYFASEKFYPKFREIHNPDFHLYVHHRIKSGYRKGENYFLASFLITAEGQIEHIEILSHVSKSADKKALKAIRSSKGSWTLPKLEGEPVSIVRFIEDRWTLQPSRADKVSFSTELSTNVQKYTNAYMKNFRSFSISWLKKDVEGALEYLDICQTIIPDEPNLTYWKYRCYQVLRNKELEDQHYQTLQKSKLKYLIQK